MPRAKTLKIFAASTLERSCLAERSELLAFGYAAIIGVLLVSSILHLLLGLSERMEAAEKHQKVVKLCWDLVQVYEDGKLDNVT